MLEVKLLIHFKKIDMQDLKFAYIMEIGMYVHNKI